jgi:hypothetical protein
MTNLNTPRSLKFVFNPLPAGKIPGCDSVAFTAIAGKVNTGTLVRL